MKHIEDSVKKSEEITSILEKNKELEAIKIQEYYKKQDQLQKQKAVIDMMIQEDFQKKQFMNEQKEKKIQQVLIVNERQESYKKSEILNKLEFKNVNVFFFCNNLDKKKT